MCSIKIESLKQFVWERDGDTQLKRRRLMSHLVTFFSPYKDDMEPSELPSGGWVCKKQKYTRVSPTKVCYSYTGIDTHKDA